MTTISIFLLIVIFKNVIAAKEISYLCDSTWLLVWRKKRCRSSFFFPHFSRFGKLIQFSMKCVKSSRDRVNGKNCQRFEVFSRFCGNVKMRKERIFHFFPILYQTFLELRNHLNISTTVYNEHVLSLFNFKLRKSWKRVSAAKATSSFDDDQWIYYFSSYWRSGWFLTLIMKTDQIQF